MSSVIATVQSIVGQVFAVSADGARRLLVEGDRLFKGEEILTGDSGMVTLKLADGRTLDLGRDSQWSESDARLAAQDAQAAQQVVSPGDEVAQLQQAIEAGMDPTQTLEATAAGPSAAGGGSGGAGGGHSFVMLDATGEVLEATVGFETSGLGDFAGADEQIQEALPNQAPEFLDGNGAPQGPLSLQTTEDTPISGAFNTRDVNGDLVTLTVTRAPTNGTLVLNANGTWTYTPSQDYNGTDSFEVTASDGRGASTPLTVNLTITPVNDAPVATGTYDATIDDSAAADTFADIKGQLTATDVDDTVLTWSGSATGAYGELTVNPDGSYTYVVDAKAVNGLQEGEQASDSFVVTVRDPSGASDTRVITINFNGANDTPITTASSAAVTEDQSVNGTLQASDADKGAVLSYSLTGNAPAGFVLNAQTGEWSLDAGNAAYQYLAEGQKLTLTVPFEVSDQLGAKTSSTLTITVTGVNDAAVLGSANVQLTETDAPLSTGGTLAISDVDSPNTFVAQSNVAGTYGTFNIDAAGNWTYVANSAFNELNVGDKLTETFEVSSADGTKTSVTVTINGSNDAAILSSANVQLTETDAPLSTGGTLTISDVDSPATFVAQNNVAGTYGTFNIDAAGNWTYLANSAFNELNVGQSYSESFKVTSADGTETSVTVTINGSNDRPVGVADHVTLDEDTTATGNVLSNDTDVDNTSLTVTKFSLTNLPFVSFNAGATADLVIGKLTIQANGDFTFVPAKDYNGPVPSITYTLSDGSATSTATLTFDIKPVNDAPVNTTPGAQTLAEDSSKTFSLLNGNSIAVSDVDGDRLTTTLSVEHGVLTLGPLKGGVSFSGNGTGSITLVGSQAAINLALQGLKYVPGKDYNGQDTLTINTTDGKLSDSDSVTLNITPVNDAPVATPTTASTLEDAPVIGGKLAATDVDGDTLTYSAKGTLPGGFTLNSDGTWTLDPSHADYQHLAEGKSTTLTINFTATDGKLSSNSTLTITVTGVNDKPTITAATATAIEGNGEISGQIAASDVDDGAVLSFSTTANVAGLTLGTDGKWTFDANNSAYDYLKGGEELVITVPVTVTDEHGASADSTLTITLTGTNDAPVANAVSASGNEDQAARIQVNLSGSDVDGTITGFTIGSVPANGTLYAGANGGTALKAGDSVTGPVYFVPNKDWNGTTTFEYSAVDNDGATSVDKATATITIAPVNDRPVGVNDSVTLDEDTTATGNVLSNDKDVDGDTLTVTKFSITGLPFVSAKAGETLDLGVGKLTIKANGDFTFVPAKDYNGPVPSVTYTLSDGSLTSTATLRFDITPVNDAPVNTTPGAQTLNEDGSKVFSIFGSNSVSVSDVDGDRLTTTLTVEHGVLTLGPLLGGVTFSGNGTGSITLSGTQAAINAALQGLKYVPAANYNGQDTLTISTSDGKLSDTDSITLNITPVNDAPVATPTSDSTVEDAPAIGGKLAATDVDGDVLTFTLKNAAPAGFSLNADGSWTFDPSNAAYQALGEGEKLVIQIPFTATDGSLSSSSTLTITVTGVNDVPTVTGAITYGTNEDAAGHVIDLLANASDADAKDVLNAVNITETSGKDASGVTIQGNTLVVDPSKYNYLAKGESVVLTYEYQVSDGKGGLVTTSATVTIDGVNDAPVVSSAIVVDSNEDAAAFNVDLLANATDVDLSDVLGISNLKQVGTQDASGVTLSGNGLQVNPNAYNYLAAGEKLVLTYSYDVVDSNGGVTPTTATITIEGRNDAPVLESTVQSGSITERADGVPGENAGSLTASGDIGFSDADLSNTHTVGSQLISAKDGKGLDVDVLGNLSAAISDSAQGDGQGSVHWNYSVAAGALDYLGAGETVTLVYRVTVTDSSGASASRDVTITLTGSNDAPIVSGVATTLTNEDEAAYSLDLLQHASDEDANDILSVDNLQLVGGGNDAGVTFDAASNSLQIDPSQYNYLAAGEKVVLNYSYEVSDGKGGVVSANASVTIEGRNDAPVVTDTSVTVAEESVGTPLNIAAPTDVDSSDVLTITVTGLPTVGTVTLANGTPVSNGQTLTSAELQGLKYNGPDDYKAGDPVGNFTYSVNDGTTSVEGKVTLGVTPVNDAPDANDDFGVIAGLKGNYYGYREGVDGGNLQNLAGVAAFIAGRTPSATFTATELNYGNGVSNNLGNDQQLQKFLGADAASLNTDPANTSDAIIEMNGQINLNAGTYQFRVTADDGYSILVDGKVVAEFNGNQSPTARESATFTITESGPHDIQIIYWDQGGQAQLKVELRPEGGSYTVVGGAQLSQAGSDLLTTNEDQALVIEPATLLGNDTDVDGDTLSIISVQDAQNGDVAIVDGKVVFTPAPNFNGTGSFTYTISDGNGKFDTATVTVGVKPVNDAPVVDSANLTVDEKTVGTPLGLAAPSDVDGNPLTITVTGLPTLGSVTLADGSTVNNGQALTSAELQGLKYNAPANYQAGDAVGNFTYSVNDGSVSVTGSVTLAVNPINDLPVLNNPSVSLDEDQSLSTQLNVSDADGDTVTYTLKSGTSNGTLVLDGTTGQYTYTPNANYNGPDSFTVTLNDGNGGVVDAVVNITVNPVNDAPVANDDSVTTLEDTAVTIDVLANDTDVDGDSLLISGANADHGSVSVVDGKLVYTPTANYSGSDTISYSISDGKGGTSTASVQVTVTPVADAPNLNVQTPAGTPHATGLTLQSWNGLALGNSGSGATPATLKATIDAAGTPTSSTSANDAHLDNVNAGVANKFSGLIYLQAGETYTFSGVGDDSVLVSVGGTTVASATWSGSSGQFSGSFTAQQSGYYTLDVYQHNQNGPGNLDVNVKVGNGPVQDLSTANVLLYRDTADLNGDGVRVSELHGSDGKGYYQVYGYNEGDENSSIPLSHLSASLVDTDLSESLSISISQIPSGVTISDGTPGHSFTADGTHSEVDISGWNLSNLSLSSPNAGSFDLKVTATATEGANGDKANTSLTLPVVVHSVNDAPTSADNTVNTNEDTSRTFSSADFAFNDVDAGDSLKAIRINSLPASGNLSLGNEAVTIGMIITAAQIASLVYTPAANASGNSSFSFSVQDQSGAFSTTPNTMTIQVAAVDDAPGLSNSTVSFAENIASGSTIADLNDRFTGTDQDRDGEPLFYSITGGNDAGLFAINSSTGVITLASGKSLDYETATQHQLQVTATDGKTPVNATVTVNVTNVNDNGVVISDANPAANTVVENAANGATVGLTVLGRDGDVGATITKYELTDNAGGRFAINASTGVVTVADGSKLDYESATSHNITVKVTSSDGSTNTQVFTINLSNVNDNGITLTDANTAINSVAENATNGTPVGITALGVDGDAGTTVTYSLTNNAGGRFAIDATTGVVTVADGSKLDYENATSHSITVLATSSDGSTQSANYSIAVTNVNEAPVVVAGAAVTGNEDSNYIFKWSDFKVSDVDANSSLSIKIETLPGEGKLQVKVGNTWTDVSANTTVTKSAIDGSGLRFVPDANESGHDSFGGNGVGLNQATYATFNYSGSDGSLPTASSTMNIDITPVADVPTLSVKSAAKSTLFTTTWESAPDSDYTSESIKGSTFENWTLVTTGDKRTGGTNVFEVWGHNDNMENQAGNLVTIKMPGTGNNDALELNDAGGTMAQTLGITRNVATEVGKVYDLSMDYAGRLGFDTTYTKIAVYLGSTLVGEYGSSSSQTSLNWENIHFSFVGTGSTEALTIKLAGTSTHESGRGALIDNITLSSSQGVVAGDGGVNGKTSIALANYISGALTDTDGSESLRYDLSSLPAGASIVVGNSTLAAVNGVVSLSAAQLATAKLQVSGAVRGEIGLDVKAVSVEPNGSTESTNSQHLTLKIVEGGVSHDSLTTNTITVADTSSALSSGLTGEYWGYSDNGDPLLNLTNLRMVEDYIESRSGNSTSLVGSNDNAAASSLNATFIAKQINYGLDKNGNTVFSDDLGDNSKVTSGDVIGKQNNLYDFLTAAGTGNVSNLKAGGANLGDTSDAIIRAHGFLSVNAGTYDIRITADDGYRLMIGGQDIANVDKIQSTTTDTYKGVSIAGGLQALELLYWDQGGAASLKVEFKLSGSADNTYKVLGSNGINLYQAPGEGQELVQTNTGWAIHTIGTTNGGDASDLINGSKYSDILNGGNGHDVLYGNGGHDLLNGGDGNDLLIGGVGNDTLIGGAGADTFMWKSGDFGNDVIKDFNAAEGDRIDISELLPDTANANNLLDYLKVDTVTNTLQVSTTGDLANNVDVTIKLEGVNLSQYGATSSQIVNSLVAGADPLVKTEHH